jgi:hypothetical protein
LLGLIVTISENEKRKNNVFRGAIDPDFLNLIPEKIGFIEKNKGWYNEKCVKVEGVLVSLQVTKPKRKSHDSQNPSYANQTRRSSQSAGSFTRENETGSPLHTDPGIRRRIGRVYPSQPI